MPQILPGQQKAVMMKQINPKQMRVAIFYNPKTNPQNIQHAREAAAALEHAGTSQVTNPTPDKLKKTDIALAVGGDGTVLYAANLLAKSRIPILGVNFGHRGYLCELDKDNFAAYIPYLKEKRYRIMEMTRLQANIHRRDGKIISLQALNEISIGGINRTVSLKADIRTPDKDIDARISGDGLIVSTRTGSTAYNINAGGPMLLTDVFAVLANNAFFDSEHLLPITRSLVVPTDTVIKAEDLSHNALNLPYVIADGQEAIKIGKSDKITIKKAKNKNYFLKF